MTTEIDPNDIQTGAVLDTQNSVYKLVGWQGDEIVIKVETKPVDAASFTVTRQAMKQVDPVGAKAKLLTEQEKHSLRLFAHHTQTLGNAMTGHRMAVYANTNAAPNWVTQLGMRVDAGLWYKMPMHAVADLKQALTRRMQPAADRGLLTTFLDTLRDPGGLESLGKIVACDLINGNGDRFSPTGGRGVNAGGVDFAFRTLVNITNVFIISAGTSRSVSGMDFIDPNSQYRFYSNTLQQIFTNSDTRWLGEHLIDTTKRRVFCRNIVWDLNLIFGAGNPNAPNRLVCAAGGTRRPEERLEVGMIAGGQQVRDGLREKYGKDKQRPAGLDSRLKALDALPKQKALDKKPWA